MRHGVCVLDVRTDWPQRTQRTQKRNRNISRKDAKAQRSEKNELDGLLNHLSFDSKLGVLYALAGVNPRVRVFQVTGKFAQASQTFCYSHTRFSQTALGKRGSPVGAHRQPKI
jgi:hypothetical protein